MVYNSAVRRPFEVAVHFIRPHGQAVKTSPFHGGNSSSNLLGVIFLLLYDINHVIIVYGI